MRLERGAKVTLERRAGPRLGGKSRDGWKGAHRISSRASTEAVVVPSPAESLVRPATSFISWAPAFSIGSGREIARAIVTPSLMTCGSQ